jgi:hypothetical protein
VIDSGALRARLDRVRDRIAKAAIRVRRDPSSVRLIAVSKTFDADHVLAAAEGGQLDFGENKVQEALAKMAATSSLSLRWHLIGHLQSNKARKAAEHFAVIHSVDSVSLLSKLDEGARAAQRILDLLVQVDLAGETTKYGASPEQVPAIMSAARECRAVRVTGLMTLPPAVDDPQAARPYFAALRQLRDDLAKHGTDEVMLRELSMGMSHDFEVAIEEGATQVRVGSAIFGERVYT